MSKTKSRAYRSSGEIRRLNTNRQSVSEIFALYRRARDIEVSAIEMSKTLHVSATKYGHVIDQKYTTALFRGIIDALKQYSSRLDDYCAKIDAVKDCHDDVTGVVIDILADFSDDQLIIDSNIYKPMHDIASEINRHAVLEDQVDLDGLAQFIEKYNQQFNVGENS